MTSEIKQEVYFEDTMAPYQYNVRDCLTGKLLGYSDHVPYLDADIDNKWLNPRLKYLNFTVHEEG